MKKSDRKVYIASALPNRLVALCVADKLRAEKVSVVSTWHDQVASSVEAERAMDFEEKMAIADQCLKEIDSCTHLLWLFGNADGRTGAPIEYGAALKSGKILLAVDVQPLDGAPGWLRCEIVKGMFNDERAVVVAHVNGEFSSHFVMDIEVAEEDKQVRVTVRERGPVMWATLPTSTGPVSIPVDRAHVTVARSLSAPSVFGTHAICLTQDMAIRALCSDTNLPGLSGAASGVDV